MSPTLHFQKVRRYDRPVLARSILYFLVLLIAADVTAHAQAPPVAPSLSRAAADNSPVSVLLQRRQELGLSDEQVAHSTACGTSFKKLA